MNKVFKAKETREISSQKMVSNTTFKNDVEIHHNTLNISESLSKESSKSLLDLNEVAKLEEFLEESRLFGDYKTIYHFLSHSSILRTPKVLKMILKSSYNMNMMT